MMLEEFQLFGDWWIPSEKTKNPVSGVLVYDATSDAKLQLIGIFDFIEPLSDIDFIVGITTTSKYVTLYNCYESNRHTANGIVSSVYKAKCVLFDAHFGSHNSFKFNKIQGYFKNLPRWVDTFGFKVESDYENDAVTINYKRPNSIECKLNEKLNLSINFFNNDFFTEDTDEITVHQSTYFEIESIEELSFEEMLGNILLLQDFLTLATLEGVHPTTINVLNKQNDFGFKIVYAQPYVLIRKNKRSREFLFKFTDIANKFELLIQKWFAQHQKIKNITVLLLESFYEFEKSQVNKFLNMCQALEAYSSNFKNRIPFDENEYNTWYGNLLIEYKDHKFLKAIKKLKYENRINLEDRLNQLMSSLNISTMDKIIDSKKTFNSLVQLSRNYYTHHIKNYADRAFKEKDLYDATEKLKVLLIGTILLETGFSLPDVEKFFSDIDKYQYRHLFLQKYK